MLDKYIADNWLSQITGKVFDLENKTSWELVGQYARVLHNTITGQAIFLKYFFKKKNFMISVNPSTKDWNDWYYISNITKEWVPIKEYEDSIANFKAKEASLPKRKAIQV